MIHFYTWATPNGREAFVDSRIAAGWPPSATRLVEGWFSATHKGVFDEPSPILETLLERKPKGLDAILHDAFFN